MWRELEIMVAIKEIYFPRCFFIPQLQTERTCMVVSLRTIQHTTGKQNEEVFPAHPVWASHGFFPRVDAKVNFPDLFENPMWWNTPGDYSVVLYLLSWCLIFNFSIQIFNFLLFMKLPQGTKLSMLCHLIALFFDSTSYKVGKKY